MSFLQSILSRIGAVFAAFWAGYIVGDLSDANKELKHDNEVLTKQRDIANSPRPSTAELLARMRDNEL